MTGCWVFAISTKSIISNLPQGLGKMIFVLIGFWCPVSFAKVIGFTDLPFWMLHRYSQMRCANTVWLVGEQLLADATVVPRVAVHALNCIFFWGGGGKERRRNISVFFKYFLFFFRWFEGFSAGVLCAPWTLSFIRIGIPELLNWPRFSHVSSYASPWLCASRISWKHTTLLRAAWWW